MKLSTAVLLTMLVFCGPLHAQTASNTQPTSQPTTQESRETQIVKMFDDMYKWAITGDRAKVRDLYWGVTVQEKLLAEAFTDYAMAGCQLEKVIRDTFGDAAASDVFHAVNDWPSTEANQLDIHFDGNRAIVEPKVVDNPTYLVHTANGWRYWMRGWTSRFPREDIQQMINSSQKMAELFKQLQQKIQTGEYKTVEKITAEAKTGFEKAWSN